MARVALPALIAAGVAAGIAGAALGQSVPESILPPGFGEPTPPKPAPKPAPGQPSGQPSSGQPAAGQSSPGQPAPGAASAARAVQAAHGPALAQIEDIIASDNLDAAEQPAPTPPVEYPDDRRRDPALAGVVSPEAIGLAGQPWGAASGKFLSVVLRRTDGPLASRWTQIGLRNLLLARTPAPGLVNPADWVAERAWLLLKLGEADSARLLVASVDTSDFTPKLVQVAAQVALANSDPAGLCAIQGRLPEVEPRIAPLVSAMCASLDGESERAAADIEQARRRGRVGGIDVALADKVVGAGADTARAVTIEWEPVTMLTAWRYGLSTATAMMPPERLLSAAQPQVRAWLARAPMFSPLQRLGPARTAAAMGVMSSDAMVDLYAAAYDYTDPDDLGGSDAWRLRQAFVGKDRDARMAALRGLWGKPGAGEKQMAGWVTTARAATLIAPDAALKDDSGDLVAALFAGGYDDQAARWTRVVERFDDEAGDRAWAMLALGLDQPSGLSIDRSRIESFAGRDSSVGKRRTRLLVAGLAGLGRIDSALAERLDQQFGLGLGRRTGWTALIDGAAARRQAGTAMLLTASAMQAPAIGEVPALYLYHALNALRRTGQEGVARMIAAEALARA